MIRRTFLFAPAAVFALATLGTTAACSDDEPTGTVTPTEAGADDAADASTSTAGQCTAAREEFLKPIGKVSTGQVVVVSDEGGVKTIYVDASAGGFDQAIKNPRVYVSLAGTRVDVTDKNAVESTEWDLAMKRQVVFTNGGDTGIGQGAAARLTKAFDDVTAADADGATLAAEDILDDECQKVVDRIGDPDTTFADWYNYDEATMRASANTKYTYIVRGGAGKRYKVGITSYTGKPDGTTTSPSTGYFLMKVAEL